MAYNSKQLYLLVGVDISEESARVDDVLGLGILADMVQLVDINPMTIQHRSHIDGQRRYRRKAISKALKKELSFEMSHYMFQLFPLKLDGNVRSGAFTEQDAIEQGFHGRYIINIYHNDDSPDHYEFNEEHLARAKFAELTPIGEDEEIVGVELDFLTEENKVQMIDYNGV